MITYRKTAKGMAEISTRANKLPPRLRAALILVDGRRSDHELSTMLPAEAENTLRWLSDSGFIELADTSANASQWGSTQSGAPASLSPQGASARAPVAREATPASRQPIAALQREAVRQLIDQAGPVLEQLAIKIEKARSREELKPLLEMGYQSLANARGAKAAADFHARFIDGL